MPGPEITQEFQALRAGDRGAFDRLLPLVYEELTRIARRQRRTRSANETLGTTALVHEAWLKLVARDRLDSTDKDHFFGIAARAMRQVLVDRARKRAALKRGGAWRRLPLDDAMLAVEEQADRLLEVDEALSRLAALDERLARVVECRFFGGMTEKETASALDLSQRTVRRCWLKARLWLYGELIEVEGES